MIGHWRSHRTLLQHPADVGADVPGAVVVPAARPVQNLSTAADLASELGCVLVVLGSQSARSVEFRSLASEWPEVRWVAIDLPAGYHHGLLEFETSTMAYATAGRVGDLSVKRNVGLLLARLVGWNSVLFLDDDINMLDPDEIRRGAAKLGQVAIAGLEVGEYPDNSVVCHANRLATGVQDVFVSGSALLVRCDRPVSFFPETYNEDWLFYFDRLAEQSVAIVGAAGQLEYEPYGDPARARRQEFGDILAEGVVNLLHGRRDLETACGPEYWKQALDARHELVNGIVGKLAGRQSEECVAAQAALEAADHARAGLDAAMFADYVRSWRNDLASWTSRLSELEPAEDLDSALRVLGLDGSAVISEAAEPAAIFDVHAAPAAMPPPTTGLMVDPSASIEATARIGAPYRPLMEGEWERLGRPTKIAAGCQIGDFCVVGEGAGLGSGCDLDAHTLGAGGAALGARVLLTHRATVDPKAVVGDDSVIGGLIAERSQVGSGCRIFGDLVHRQLDPTTPWDADESMEGSPVIEDGAFVGWGATVIGGVTIGAGAYVCAGAIVTKDVPPGQLVSGVNVRRTPADWDGPLAKSAFFDGRPVAVSGTH